MPYLPRQEFGIHCPMFNCGELIEVSEKDFRRHVVDYCPHCQTEIWPCLKGFTGNDPETNNEFARTHDYDGNTKTAV